MVYALIILFAIDFVLLIAIMSILRKQSQPDDILRAVTEERQMFQDQRNQIQGEINHILSECRRMYEQTQKNMMESEMEIKQGMEIIRKESETQAAELVRSCDKPMSDITKKTSQLEYLYKKVDLERKNLQAVISKAERLIEFFDDKRPYEVILEELQTKKYQDARRLITQGRDLDEVASELNLSPSEVKLMMGYSNP